MKVLIMGGGGKIGRAVAWDLASRSEVKTVGIADIRGNKLEEVKAWVNSTKIRLHPLNRTDQKATRDLMQGYDVAVLTLPDRRSSYKAIEAAIEAGTNLVDILEEYHRRPDTEETEGLELPPGMIHEQYGEWLHESAIQKGVTILDGMGFEPGISNITLGQGIRLMDRVESATVRVGGIPSKETAKKRPLKYVITWHFDHVLREYMLEKVAVVKNGQVVHVEATSERESFEFTEFCRNEELEAAIISGMPSIVYTRPDLVNFAAKTIRWPGHWQAIADLKECGLLDLDPIKFNGQQIVPREFLLTLIEPKLRKQSGDTDACVMWNTVNGVKDGQSMRADYYMWDEEDADKGLTSMARVTGFTAAAGAVMLGRGEISQKGIVPPEDCIEDQLYERLKEELEQRNIEIKEKITLNFVP